MTWEEAVAWLRDQPDQKALVEACFFDDPLAGAARRFRACTEWTATRGLLPPPPGRALDLGAGRGIASYALAEDGYAVTALEPDPSELVGAGAIKALAATTGGRIDVVENWGEELPFPDDSFDLVLCRQVLHHARDLNELLRQIKRVLKPGGRVLATREHVLSKREDLPIFLEQHPLHKLYGGENAFLLSEYHQAIAGAGLKLVKSLNPLRTDINLFPMTLDDHRALLARRWRIPAFVIPDWVLGRVGERMDFPGRLYTFLALKP